MKVKKIISFDPNLRENLWNNLSDAKKQMLYNLNYPLCPVERWAELNSFGKLIELNKHLNNIQGINEVYKFLSVYQQIKGYKKNEYFKVHNIIICSIGWKFW